MRAWHEGGVGGWVRRTSASPPIVLIPAPGPNRTTPFNCTRQMLDLVPHAESVTKLAAKCILCSQQGVESAAHFTVRRREADGSQRLVGGAESYAAVCRSHYVEAAWKLESQEP